MQQFQTSESTRYLCAAAYLDRKFRERVIHDIVEEQHKAIGDPAGVDLGVVAAHCLAARRRERVRAGWLCLLAPLVLIAGYFLSRRTEYFYDDYYGYSYSYTRFDSYIFLLFIVLLFIIAWLVVFIDRMRIDYGVIIPNLLRGHFIPNSARVPSNALVNIPPPQDKNLIIYSGYAPFVGAGFNIGGWSIAVNVGRGKEVMGQVKAPRPFTTQELYTAVAQGASTIPLPHYSIAHILLVDGQSIRDNTYFIPDPTKRPYTEAHPTLVASFVDKPTENVRHYLRFQVQAWHGELVFSMHLHFVKVGLKLFIEAEYSILPPVSEAYRKIDAYERHATGRRVRQLLGESAALAIPALFAASGQVSNIMFHSFARAGAHRQALRDIRDLQTFDYGAKTSIREQAASVNYRHYFQQSDVGQFQKILERQILESIVTFLDSRDIDTADFNEQRTTILNSGVIVSGGALNAGNLAVGNQAKAGGGIGTILRNVRGGNAPAAGNAPAKPTP
jgi:hypothetical protein